MFLTVLGCSGSIGGPTSPASGYLVEVDGVAPVVIDMGPGVLGALQRFVSPEDATVLLSHLHADHCLDVPGLLVLRRYGPEAERARRVPLIGPSGTAYRIGVASAEEPGAVDDLSDTFDVGSWDVTPEVEMRGHDGEVGLHVRAGRVDHPPESYGMRLTSVSGRVLVYSGDTAYCDALVDLAAGADVLLCEASWTHEEGRPPGIHMSGAEAGRTARRAGVGRLVLTHIPPWTDRERVRAEAAVEFSGEVLLAEPDLRIDV
ncbi:MBL fold metallo-hydrolase [Dietzia sp. UBA5065]|uniref:MBL fold metallo-hydrolase n=1 Tax=Dietzia sp. UBA5065 TaxID=1946422 RepID=UPI0025BFDD64|nr:MBL fold metallo-hydrolase [Dietzia sp. UBA5065]HMT49546.1 MBL fold metallo-hydrolase [Dietzia sp.]